MFALIREADRLLLFSCTVEKLGLVRIAVVGTVSVLNALHSKVRQLFAEEVYLDVCCLAHGMLA